MKNSYFWGLLLIVCLAIFVEDAQGNPLDSGPDLDIFKAFCLQEKHKRTWRMGDAAPTQTVPSLMRHAVGNGDFADRRPIVQIHARAQ